MCCRLWAAQMCRADAEKTVDLRQLRHRLRLEMAAEETTSANEYILHHLTFLSNKEPKGIVDFSVIHWDTVFFSVALALLFGGSFYLAARTAKAGAPRGFQSFVELLVEFVDTQVKDSFHGTNKLLAPLALTIFCWVFLLNAMDILPVDLLPWAAHHAAVENLTLVPTTVHNLTYALSLNVYAHVIYYTHTLEHH